VRLLAELRDGAEHGLLASVKAYVSVLPDAARSPRPVSTFSAANKVVMAGLPPPLRAESEPLM
jgi:hypothetical protein